MRLRRTVGEGWNVLLLEPEGLLEPRSGTKARVYRTVGIMTFQNSFGDEGCTGELLEGEGLPGSSPHFGVEGFMLSAGRLSRRMRGHLSFRVDECGRFGDGSAMLMVSSVAFLAARWLGSLALQFAALTWKNSGLVLEDRSLSGEKIDKLQLVAPDEGVSSLQRGISGFSRACHKCLRTIVQLIIL